MFLFFFLNANLMSGEFSLWTEGGYDIEEKAARAYDLVALKYLLGTFNTHKLPSMLQKMAFLAHNLVLLGVSFSFIFGS